MRSTQPALISIAQSIYDPNDEAEWQFGSRGFGPQFRGILDAGSDRESVLVSLAHYDQDSWRVRRISGELLDRRRGQGDKAKAKAEGQAQDMHREDSEGDGDGECWRAEVVIDSHLKARLDQIRLNFDSKRSQSDRLTAHAADRVFIISRKEIDKRGTLYTFDYRVPLGNKSTSKDVEVEGGMGEGQDSGCVAGNDQKLDKALDLFPIVLLEERDKYHESEMMDINARCERAVKRLCVMSDGQPTAEKEEALRDYIRHQALTRHALEGDFGSRARIGEEKGGGGR